MRRPAIGAVFVLGISAVVAILALRGGVETRVDPLGADPGYRRLLHLFGPDGEPVSGVEVALHVRRTWELFPEFLGESRSGSDGSVHVPEYEARRGEEVVAAVRPPAFACETFVLTAGTRRLELSPGAAHRGRVVTIAGEPLPGARVVSPPHPPYVATATTDEAGRYRFGSLAADAVIRAEAMGFAPVDLGLFLYSSEDPEVVFYLVPGREVSGRVVDTRGDGVDGAVVELDQEVVSRVLADEEGCFVMPGVLNDWEVLMTPRAEARVGYETWGVPGQRDLELVLYRPAEIRGRAVLGASGSHLKDFEVSGVWVKGEETGSETEGIGFRHLDVPVAVSDTGFRIAGVVPGTVRIEAAAGSLIGDATVKVFEGRVHRDITILLYPPRWGPAEDSRPAWPITVKAVNAETGAAVAGVRIRGRATGRETRTGADGYATVTYPRGAHEIEVGGHFEEFGHATVEVVTPCEAPVEVEVERNVPTTLELLDGWARLGSKLWLHCDGEVVEVEFTGNEVQLFLPRDRTFDLMIKAKACAPVTRRWLDAPADGRLRIPLEKAICVRGRCLGAGGHTLAKVVVEVEENPLDARMETMGDGVFEVGPLEPGSVTVLFYARNVRSRRIETTVTEDGVDLGDVTMAPPCNLNARVVDSAGRPVSGAVVETAYLVSAKGVTDGEGRVTLPGRNLDEVLRVRKSGFIDGWREVLIPEGAAELSATVTMLLPARILVRVVDEEGRPLVLDLPADDPALVTGAGEIHYDGLRPGPFEREFTDRGGRTGRLQIVLREGENPPATVTLR